MDGRQSSVLVAVTAGASNAGPATVSFRVAPNTDTRVRSATVLAAGWNFTVLQAAAPAPLCTYAVSPTSLTVAAAATSASFTVSAAAGCAWTATSPVSWAVITSGGSGDGAGTVTLSVSRNNSRFTRSATLTIAGQNVVLTQHGKIRR